MLLGSVETTKGNIAPRTKNTQNGIHKEANHSLGPGNVASDFDKLIGQRQIKQYISSLSNLIWYRANVKKTIVLKHLWQITADKETKDGGDEFYNEFQSHIFNE